MSKISQNLGMKTYGGSFLLPLLTGGKGIIKHEIVQYILLIFTKKLIKHPHSLSN